MAWPPALRSLQHRDFRLFWLGQTLSMVGTWMHSVGLSWLVLEMTGSPLKLGLVGSLQFTPMLLFSIPAGALVDRLPRRRTLMATQALQALLALVLAVLVATRTVTYWHVAVLAFLGGLVLSIDAPARQSFLAGMVESDDLINAVALNSAVFNGARIVGPALAGAVIAWGGLPLTFALNAVSFLAVLLALLAIREEGAPEGVAPAFGAHVREGLRFALRTPRVVLPLVLMLIVSLFLLNHNVMVPVLAREGLHLGARGFGMLMSSLGLGAVVGALVLASRQGRPRLLELLWPAAGLGLLTVGLAFPSEFRVAAVVLAATGFCQILFTARCNTALQLATPQELRGRVMGLYGMVFAGAAPLGAFTAGALAESVGVSSAYGLLGAMGFLLVLTLATFTSWQSVPRRGSC